MNYAISDKHRLKIDIYKGQWQYRLKVINWSYNENYGSDIWFDNMSDLIKELQKEIDFYKEINKNI